MKNHKQVKIPRSTEISNEDSVARHGRKERLPGGVGDRWYGLHLRMFSQGTLDVRQFFRLYARVVSRLLEHQPQPRHVPDQSHDAVEDEGRPGADAFDQFTRNRHAKHQTGVAAAEGQSRQAGALQRGSPVPHDAVAGRVCHPLNKF